MPKFFVSHEQIAKRNIVIVGNDVNHIKNVLRTKIEDEIIICDKQDSQDYLCKICNINDKEIQCEIIKKLETNSESNIQITVFQGIPKSDKMEYIIQKSVELGAYSIIPVQMARCIVKLNEKDQIKKINRWQKISEVASKQCGRNIIPEIKNSINIKNICNLCQEYDIVLVAYENEEQQKLKYQIEKLKQLKKEKLKIAIVIGPEGGITQEEIQMLENSGAYIITLGRRILRTETVALNMISILMYELES